MTVEEIIENERRNLIRKYRASKQLCIDLQQRTKAELLFDAPDLAEETRRCLRGFYSLFELAIRNLGGTTTEHFSKGTDTQAPDWFERVGQRTVGASQEGINGSGSNDLTGEVSVQYVFGETNGGAVPESSLFFTGDVKVTDA